jgi:hypothetical protein
MKIALLSIALLAIGACRERTYNESNTNAVRIIREGQGNVIPLLQGCFKLPMLRTQDIKASTQGDNGYFDERCNFVAKEKNSAAELLASADVNFTKNNIECLVAFESPKRDIVFQYSLLARVSSGEPPTASWTEVLVKGSTETIFSEKSSQYVTIKLEPESFDRKTISIVRRNKDSGIIYLSPIGASSPRMGKIVVDYTGSNSYVAKYDGHIVQNIPCP